MNRAALQDQEGMARAIALSPKRVLRKVLKMNEAGLLLAVIVFGIVISINNPVFLKQQNLLNVARVSAFTFIVGSGMTICFVGGGLDLSVGSAYGAAGILGALALRSGVSVPLSILIGLGCGLAIGMINGTIITRFGIPSLIVTLGMMYAARGVVMVVSHGDPVYRFPQAFKEIGQGGTLGIPNPILIALAYGLFCHLVLDYTKFGYAVRGVGGNQEAARVSGINVKRIQFWLYVISGFSAGFAGLLMTSRLGSSHPNSGVGLELQIISAVIVGGTSMFGGTGSIFGTLLGSLLLNMINNGIVLMNVNLYWQNIVVGAVIVAAVGVDQFRRKRLWRSR
jgi:ribose/xylose/arabinose/galactoside ABC-type transport system permease subunit